MHIDFVVVVRFVLLEVKEAIIVVFLFSSLAAGLEELLVGDHEWAVDFVLRPRRLVKVTSPTFRTREDHFALGAASDSLQLESFRD